MWCSLFQVDSLLSSNKKLSSQSRGHDQKNYFDVYSLAINVLLNNASLLRKFQFTLAKYFDARLPTAQINPTRISKINTGFQFLTIAAALCFPIMGYKDHELFLALW